ncbi:hypothetical protein KC878_02295 [Candidatus Saccharibacteria bacterium]|nr:hypothetical protein [Candidatus Saccharibacteria bacterium]MCB9821073.1 hypothetical protein [Candidatus Nomurabacteria bacterium]
MATKKKASNNNAKVWAALRILIGLIFLWAFLDKMFGLGYSTCRIADKTTGEETVQVGCAKAVVNDEGATAHPTEGFLKFAAKGPFQDFYSGLAGKSSVDFLFMTGLLLIGLALVSGVGVTVACVSGIAMLLMMWSAVLPPENNPVLDDHIVYAVVLVGVMLANKEQVWGLGKKWQAQDVVKRFRFLA